MTLNLFCVDGIRFRRVVVVALHSILFLVVATGCAPRGDNPARKEIRPPTAPPPPARVVHDPIDPDLRGKARVQLNEALRSNDPILRANAIEGLQESIGAESQLEVMGGLKDEQELVRFASAMAAGALRLTEAHDTLVILADDPNRNVQVAARYALHRIGDRRRSHDLEKMSQDPDRGVRANVALVLGRMGEPSAVVILRTMDHDSEALVRLQVAEALWRLGDQQGLEDLVAATISSAPDDQIIATIALAGPRDDRVIGHIYAKLTSDYPEVSLAAARSLGMLGSDAGYTIAINSVRASDPRRRALAAFALGAIGRSDAQSALAKLLGDPDIHVRIAAATAILKLKPPAVPAK